MTRKYTVTSDRLSREPGESFTDDELGGANIAALIAGGHLTPAHSVRKSTPGQPATNQEK